MVKLQNVPQTKHKNNMYTIGDLMIRLKNGYMARKSSIKCLYSHFSQALLDKLQQLEYIQSYTIGDDVKKTIIVELRYNDGRPAITDVKIFSKPGQRRYISAKKLKPVLSNLGHAILSSPLGLVTNHEARKKHVGGEFLFEIW